MLITLLHFGLLAPTSRLKQNAPSAWTFILANLVADVPVVLHLYMPKVKELGGRKRWRPRTVFEAKSMDF